MPNLYTDIINDDDQWSTPNPDHATVLATMDGSAAADRPTAMAFANNLAVHSPTALAFVLTGDPDYIYVGWGPTVFPANPSNATGYDGHTLVMLGNNIDTALPVCLPDECFARAAQVTAFTNDYIVGANGHTAAAGAVFRFGHQADGAADTSNLRYRGVFPLSKANMLTILPHIQNTGRISLLAFHTRLIAPGLASADAAVRAATGPIRDWYRVACMNVAAAPHNPRTGFALTHDPAVLAQQAMASYANHLKIRELSKLGVGGPQLTTAAFEHGMNQLRLTHERLSQDTIDYHTNRDQKTFTTRHGTALAQRVQNWCHAANDAGLPEIHRLCSAAQKHQVYGILTSCLQARTLTSTVPLTLASAPLATPSLVDDLFRNYIPGGTGLVFGRGNTPFAVVCEGHKERDLVVRKINQATLAEQGSSLSLRDAELLTSTDVRFPTDAQVAAEKLYGFSVVVDVFHGPGHPVSTNTRNFACTVGPALHRIASQHLDNPAVGVDMVCRVLYEVQQDYFNWLRKAADDYNAVAPDYGHILDKVVTYRVGSLSALPADWYTLYNSGHPSGRGTDGRGPDREASNNPVGGRNPNSDSALTSRFSSSGHSSIKELMAEHDVTIPKQGSKEVCLTWAFKGYCGRNCKRAGMHVPYGPATVRKLHQVLTDCGVANPSG